MTRAKCITRSVEYWHHYFKTDSLSEQDFGGDGSQVGMCLSIACNSSSVWIVCDKCAKLINADANAAKQYASKGENPPNCSSVSSSEAAIPAALSWSLVYNEWPISIQIDENPITHNNQAGPRCDFCCRILTDKKEQISVMPEPAYKKMIKSGAKFIRSPQASKITAEGIDVWTACSICMQREISEKEKNNLEPVEKLNKKWWHFWK